jgi:hypothetical protein
MPERISVLAVVSLVIGVCSSAGLAGGPMGPPRAIVGHDRWVVDFEYAHTEIDLKTCGKCQEAYEIDGWVPLPASYREFKIKDLKSNLFFGSLGYGVSENLDVFVRLGAADAKDDIGSIRFPEDCPQCAEEYSFSGSHGFAWGVGTRATFCQAGNLSWGGLFQISWIDPDQSDLSWQNPADPGERVTGKMDLDWRQVQVAVGPTWQIRDSLCVYGGPFWHFVRGDLDVKSTWILGGAEAGRLVCSHDVTEQSEFGGYFGALWNMTKRASVYAEYQVSDHEWGLGLGYVWALP